RPATGQAHARPRRAASRNAAALIAQRASVGAASVVMRENWMAAPIEARMPPDSRPARQPKCLTPMAVTIATVATPHNAPKTRAAPARGDVEASSREESGEEDEDAARDPPFPGRRLLLFQDLALLAPQRAQAEPARGERRGETQGECPEAPAAAHLGLAGGR